MSTPENVAPTATPEGQPPQDAPPAVPLPPAYVPSVTQRRSPGLTVVLSFFPGLGHLYLGLYQRGIVFFAAFALSIWMTTRADLGILIPFVWFFCVIDAYRQANYINTGQLPETEPPKPAGKGNLGFGIFLTALGLLLLYDQFYDLDLSFLIDWWPMLLVIGGVYLLARHFLEEKRKREAQQKAYEDY